MSRQPLPAPLLAPSAPSARKAIIAGILVATALFTPMVAGAGPVMAHHHHMMGKTPEERAESVEQRITTLHTRLQITPGEEASWRAVAAVMRDNEARMRAMVLAREAEPAHHVDALEDLRTYEHFVQAHVDGLKQLRGVFEVLYNTMPDDQKLVADGVFAKFGDRHH